MPLVSLTSFRDACSGTPSVITATMITVMAPQCVFNGYNNSFAPGDIIYIQVPKGTQIIAPRVITSVSAISASFIKLASDAVSDYYSITVTSAASGTAAIQLFGGIYTGIGVNVQPPPIGSQLPPSQFGGGARIQVSELIIGTALVVGAVAVVATRRKKR